MSAPNGLMRPRSLGSKSRSFLPSTKSITPARQDDQPPTKKFRSSAAPKGTKLASGYVDRASARQNDAETTDDKQVRLKRLEEMLKLEQIDETTFAQLKDELGIGGDAETTHLVKGLDFKLLERIRRGEDVLNSTVEEAQDVDEDPADVEDELERVLEKDVSAPARTKTTEAADTQTTTTLSRDELLKRLKQNRRNPTVQVEAAPSLDQSKFRKIETAPKAGKKKFTESVNGRRREVLVITDKDGKQKRKTRWIDPEPVEQKDDVAWGGDLPEEVLARQKNAAEQAQMQADEDDDADIFGGVAEYDPLAELGSDEEGQESNKTTKSQSGPEGEGTGKRNYFGTAESEDAGEKSGHDPSILAALKRAAQLRREEEGEDGSRDGRGDGHDEASGDRSAALLKRLQKQSRQDDMDLDMAFDGRDGYGDEDEMDGKQKLSEWKGAGQDDDEDDAERGRKGAGTGSKRKRGGKKKKGDKNNFADVMSVIEGRKKI